MATLDELYNKALEARQSASHAQDDLEKILGSKPVRRDVLLSMCLDQVLVNIKSACNKADSIQSNLSYGPHQQYEVDGLKNDNDRLIKRVDELKARLMSLSKLIPPTQLADDEIDQLHKGNLIMAIKMCRERTGLGLREAKDMVEKVRDSATDVPF